MMDFTLRPFEERDIDAIARYGNNEKIAANLRNRFPYPYTPADARSYVESCMQNGEVRQCTRAIDVNGECVGSVGLFIESDIYEKSAEVGYWLAEPFWGKGITSEAVRQICDYGFAHYSIVRIFAEPFAYNKGSCRVLEKSGFTLEGVKKCAVYKNGVIHDSKMYALVQEDGHA